MPPAKRTAPAVKQVTTPGKTAAKAPAAKPAAAPATVTLKHLAAKLAES
jgi:hypothetical protein